MAVDFSGVGVALANPARSAIIDHLLGGGSVSASMLAKVARIAPSTASGHLSALRAAGFVTESASGRYRFYSLAGPDVAEALEALARICPPVPVRSLSQSIAGRRLAFARTCYDHLAGQVGVALLDVMLSQRWIRPSAAGYEITTAGERRLAALGVNVDVARSERRTFARPCLDWTERRFHLAGALGAALCSSMLENGWFRRDGMTGRSVVLTREGEAGLTSLGIESSSLERLAS